ncbi:deoxyguanosinetriphosphate triphosphohydrolase [Sphingoaurantiacus capsulatus]|uniref:Deoxyguanosinetriphosphate triphosphohydrolase-like protein n=1 Tax=Sphingoaurantiacus capsulatus TaxID=1771310 RepID=A0ABV7XCT5_9SPHN
MTPAAYATDPARSRGRQYPQPDSSVRDPFQRDRDRIIHATAFRRLKHKTQVFVSPDGDHFRTRLTHSLEVAQIGRVIARALGLHEDLTEALCLGHDLGHPPFGHVGEDVLTEAMAPYGGFDHNANTLRIVTKFEQRYADFDGLNLTWETLEGLAKHNGPIYEPTWALAEIDAAYSLDLGSYSSLEAQVAALADDIAYDNHDLDDGLRAGLFTIEDAKVVPFIAESWAMVTERFPNAASDRLPAELVRHQIGRMVADVLAETRRRIAEVNPQSVEDVRAAGRTLVGFSSAMAKCERDMKLFLRERMYFHPYNLGIRKPAREIVAALFERFHSDPDAMPDGWGASTPADEPARARHVADFIAGMTDRYAIRTYRRLIGDIEFPGDGFI